MRPYILNQEQITLGVPILFVHPRYYFFTQEEVIGLLRVQLLVQKGVVIAWQLPRHLQFGNPVRKILGIRYLVRAIRNEVAVNKQLQVINRQI